jgi:hypothetical protein
MTTFLSHGEIKRILFLLKCIIITICSQSLRKSKVTLCIIAIKLSKVHINLRFRRPFKGFWRYMEIIDLKQIQQYYGTQVTLRGGYAREGWGKRRKPKTWMRLMCSPYRNEYRNLKLAEDTMGSGLGKSKEVW